jgi:RND family efflux transporter MFP subunit
MKIKHRTALILTVSLIAILLAYGYVKIHSSTVESIATIKTSPALPPLITTARPVMRQFTLRVPWIGTVESRASVELIAQVAGRIEVIEAEDQVRMRAGQPVMRLGGPKVEGVRSKLTTEIEFLKSQLDDARQTVERLNESLKAQLATKNQVAAAQNSQIKLESQLREAQLNLKTFENQVCISAPINGIFTNRRVSLGQDVNAGLVIGEIMDADRLRIAASIFPPQGIDLQGKQASIRLDQDHTLTGLVRRVLPQASDTGATMVWIESPHIDAQLHPGQTAGGNIIVHIRPETLAVPESTIVYDSNEHPYLFVQKDSAYVPLRVRLGLIQDGWVEILSGLEQNQFVVTHGAYELFYRQFNEQFKVQD